jgi:hypothetical protein
MTAAGVPGDKIIETNQMYKLPDSIDAANTIFITAVGAPDADRLNPDTYTKRDQKDKEGNVTKPAGSPSYYKIWGSAETPVTADRHGYVIVIPEIQKEITIKGKKYDVSHGTECRNLWNSIRNDAKARAEFLSQMYVRPSQELAVIFDKIPQTTAEDIGADSQTSTSPIHGTGFKQGVAEDAAGVGVVAKNKKMARDPRYSMSITKDVKPSTPKNMLRAFRLSEDGESSKEEIVAMIKQFLPLAMKELNIKELPRIILKKQIEAHDGQATFGRFVDEEEKIYLGIASRHPVDILRTLAHELVHFKQHTDGKMYPKAGETGSPIENEANVKAAIIMRHFNKKYPDAVKADALSINESLSAKYQLFKENFADGRNPQDKGDSKRHGVPTKASVSTLRKVAKQGGRKGQLAHWMANMKAGKAKKK